MKVKLFFILISSLLSGFGFMNFAGAGQLVYSTFIGGSEEDSGTGFSGFLIAIDTAGNAYITGHTLSPDFPTTSGAFDTTQNGGWDVFVTKLNTTGSALLYSTFLGGSGHDIGYGIAVDKDENAYITGYTSSLNFPTTPSAFDTTFEGGYDAFVTKLDSSGSTLLYSTFLGGGGDDWYNGIAVDNTGNAYITGWTGSSDFPTTSGAFDTTYNGGWDVFITKLNTTGSALLYSTFLGGSNSDYIGGIALDNAGNAYITGWTNSSDFPITANAFDTIFNGYSNLTSDVFVSKLNSTGSVLLYSTFLGGTNKDSGKSISIDNTGNAYILGLTYSSDFLTTPDALDTTFNGVDDVFVAKLNAAGRRSFIQRS